jgi:hypothetical protein
LTTECITCNGHASGATASLLYHSHGVSPPFCRGVMDRRTRSSMQASDPACSDKEEDGYGRDAPPYTDGLATDEKFRPYDEMQESWTNEEREGIEGLHGQAFYPNSVYTIKYCTRNSRHQELGSINLSFPISKYSPWSRKIFCLPAREWTSVEVWVPRCCVYTKLWADTVV